jgi:hypothetical protein
LVPFGARQVTHIGSSHTEGKHTGRISPPQVFSTNAKIERAAPTVETALKTPSSLVFLHHSFVTSEMAASHHRGCERLTVQRYVEGTAGGQRQDSWMERKREGVDRPIGESNLCTRKNMDLIRVGQHWAR